MVMPWPQQLKGKGSGAAYDVATWQRCIAGFGGGGERSGSQNLKCM